MNKITLLIFFLIASLLSVSAQEKSEIDQLLTRLEKSGDSYLIKNIKDLEWLSEKTNSGIDFFEYNFKLTGDIYNYDQQYRWTPIGTETTPFRGNFDGNGQYFDGVNIESNQQYIGLFGYAKDGIIKNLKLRYFSVKSSNTDSSIKQYTGIIAGYSSSVIINCYVHDNGSSATFRPIHSTYCVGGIVGKADNAVYNCFADLNYIEGTTYAGGVVGESSSIVKNCFTRIGSLNGINKGHIIGNQLTASKLVDNYRDKNNTAPSNGTTEIDGQELDKKEFIEKLNINLSEYGKYFPLCIWTNDGITSSWADFIGEGTPQNPYLVVTPADLIKVAEKVNQGNYLDKSFKVINNIDMSGEKWIPIGCNSQHIFKGKFDGNGKTISNLTMSESQAFSGLIGYMHSGEVKNVIIYNCKIIGDNAGGIVGSLESSTAINNIIYGTIEILDGKEKFNKGRIVGAIDNSSSLDQNYATGNAISNDNKDGITLVEISESNSIIKETGAYLLTGSEITVDAENVFVFCLPNREFSKITLNETTRQGGWLRAKELQFATGTTFQKTADAVEAEEYILYRIPKIWAQKSGTGWETICLPFDANVYANGILKSPVTISTKGSFWLRKFVAPTGNAENDVIHFASYENIPANGYAIQKNTPYIIALPGQGYGNNSLEGQTITFRGEGSLPIVDEKPQTIIDNSNFIFEGCHQQEAAAGRYLLQEGTTFKWNESDPIAPYQAYFLPKGTSASNVQVLRIATGTNQPTDLTDGRKEDKSIRTYVADGVVYLTSDRSQIVKIWNAASGMGVREIEVNNETVTISGLPKGIYIIDREKIAVY